MLTCILLSAVWRPRGAERNYESRSSFSSFIADGKVTRVIIASSNVYHENTLDHLSGSPSSLLSPTTRRLIRTCTTVIALPRVTPHVTERLVSSSGTVCTRYTKKRYTCRADTCTECASRVLLVKVKRLARCSRSRTAAGSDAVSRILTPESCGAARCSNAVSGRRRAAERPAVLTLSRDAG